MKALLAVLALMASAPAFADHIPFHNDRDGQRQVEEARRQVDQENRNREQDQRNRQQDERNRREDARRQEQVDRNSNAFPHAPRGGNNIFGR